VGKLQAFHGQVHHHIAQVAGVEHGVGAQAAGAVQGGPGPDDALLLIAGHTLRGHVDVGDRIAEGQRGRVVLEVHGAAHQRQAVGRVFTGDHLLPQVAHVVGEHHEHVAFGCLELRTLLPCRGAIQLQVARPVVGAIGQHDEMHISTIHQYATHLDEPRAGHHGVERRVGMFQCEQRLSARVGQLKLVQGQACAQLQTGGVGVIVQHVQAQVHGPCQ
jgi:hypothetical protein